MPEIVIDTVEKYLRHIAAFKRSSVDRAARSAGLDVQPYATQEDFLLRHGRLWTAQARPKAYRKLPFKQCFNNAFDLAFNNPGELIYVEGFAQLRIPVHHAWCVDRQGRVVDATWEDTETGQYFGIPFNLDYLIEVATSREQGWSMLDDWEGGWPLLTGKVSAETYHSPHFDLVDRPEIIEEIETTAEEIRQGFAQARELMEKKSK